VLVLHAGTDVFIRFPQPEDRAGRVGANRHLARRADLHDVGDDLPAQLADACHVGGRVGGGGACKIHVRKGHTTEEGSALSRAEREAGYANKPIADILKEFCAYTDGAWLDGMNGLDWAVLGLPREVEGRSGCARCHQEMDFVDAIAADYPIAVLARLLDTEVVDDECWFENGNRQCHYDPNNWDESTMGPLPSLVQKTSTYGMHEPYSHWLACKTRRRNRNLFVADQNPGPNARNTRQNPGGTRH